MALGVSTAFQGALRPGEGLRVPAALGSVSPGPVPSPDDREASRLQLSPLGDAPTPPGGLLLAQAAGEEPRGRAGVEARAAWAPAGCQQSPRAGAGIWLSWTVL